MKTPLANANANAQSTASLSSAWSKGGSTVADDGSDSIDIATSSSTRTTTDPSLRISSPNTPSTSPRYATP